jgi:hypothetical protein
MILRGLDNSRYYQLKTDLANDMTKEQDNYPKTIVEMTHLLNNYKVPVRQQRVKDPSNNGVAFVQTGPKKPGANAPLIGDVDCWHCGKRGHFRSDCPELQVQELGVGVQNLHIDDCKDEHGLFSSKEDKGLAFTQKGGERGVCGVLSKYHVYIDTCARYSSTPYQELLKNIEQQKRGLVGHSNAGSCGMGKVGDLGAIKQVWLNWLSLCIKHWSSCIVNDRCWRWILYCQWSWVTRDLEWCRHKECIHGSCHDQSRPFKYVALGATYALQGALDVSS